MAKGWAMIMKTIGWATVGSLLFGCASGQMTMPKGYLTEPELKQINVERQKIVKECRSRYAPLESAAWECLRELVPLTAQMGSEYSESWAIYIKQNKRVARRFEKGAISEQDALDRMSRIVGQLVLDMQVLEEQIERKQAIARS
jgi:hypothetical protein